VYFHDGVTKSDNCAFVRSVDPDWYICINHEGEAIRKSKLFPDYTKKTPRFPEASSGPANAG
jgi:hypothetical protein